MDTNVGFGAARHSWRLAFRHETVRDLVMKERTTYLHEEEWGTVTVQRLYKLRCECGRSWFELELPKFVRCPACHKLGLVSQ